MTDNLHLDRIEELAEAYANQWLEQIDYLTIHEMLEEDMIPYTDDDAEKIFVRIITSKVRFV